MSTKVLAETINWVRVDDDMPDAGICVFITNAVREPWVGFYDDEDDCWRNADASRCSAPITYWAEFPQGPE